jgi:hypothetical protein
MNGTYTAEEREWVGQIKALPCGVCGQAGPSEAHHIVQGLHFMVIPLCPDCHRGEHNGIHGRRCMWNVKKLDQRKVLNNTLRIMNKMAKGRR